MNAQDYMDVSSDENNEENDLDESYSDDEQAEKADLIDVALSATEDDMATTMKKSEQLEVEMARLAAETAEVIGIDPALCKILLSHNKWNRETVLEKFYEAGDQDSFLADSHVVLKKDDSKEMCSSLCEICLDEKLVLILSCSHKCCLECWKDYLVSKVNTDNVYPIPCVGFKCKAELNDEMVMSILLQDGEDNKNVMKFRKLIVRSFVMNHPYLKACPESNCELVTKVPDIDVASIKCRCGFCFCAKCVDQFHEPLDCDLLRSWKKKCADDSETVKWIDSYTKDCPRCKSPIEKNGGCHHMSCTKCRYEFCWFCMEDWMKHGYERACNRYKDAKANDENVSSSRTSLQRYLHYFERYIGHQTSINLQERLPITCAEKMFSMQKEGVQWIEVQYLEKAIEPLAECRRTLMYSYVFAYYLNDSHEKKIFEDNQQDLEIAVERLSELLERNLDKTDKGFVQLRIRVEDCVRYVVQRRRTLVEHVKEGLEKNQWIFIQDKSL